MYFTIYNWYCFVAHMFWLALKHHTLQGFAQFACCLFMILCQPLFQEKNTVKTQKSVEVESKEILLWLYTSTNFSTNGGTQVNYPINYKIKLNLAIISGADSLYIYLQDLPIRLRDHPNSFFQRCQKWT